MSARLVKAIGAASLLHVAVMAAAQYVLPRGPRRARVEAPTALVESASPLAVEFLLESPPSADVGSAAARPAEPGSTVPIPPRHKPGRLSSAKTGTANRPDRAAPDSLPPAPEGAAFRMRTDRMMEPAAPMDTRIPPSSLARIAGTASVPSPPPPRHESSPWQASGGGSLRATGQPFRARIRSDGTIDFRDRPNLEAEGLSGRFDVTDAVMSALGQTLYPYRKMKLMEESREMRMNMATASRQEDLRSALRTFDNHLRAVWEQTSLSLWERKLALFRLWDECAEDGSPEVVVSANSIRATTLSFIRNHLPKGSIQAYNSAELDRLNRIRRSRTTFAPYTASP